MPFTATVYKVLIASPGDVASQRLVIRDALNSSNSVFGESQGIMFLPVMWEVDAVPAVRQRAQEIINQQLVQSADMLIGTFWTRFGTPTLEAGSGTEEEIRQFIASDRPVMLYFSTAEANLRTVNLQEYSRVEAFRKSIQGKGLYDEYGSDEELRAKLTDDLSRTIQQLTKKHQGQGDDNSLSAVASTTMLTKEEFRSYTDTYELNWNVAKARDEAIEPATVAIPTFETYGLIQKAEASFHDFAHRMNGTIEAVATQSISNLGNRAWEIANNMRYRREAVAKDSEVLRDYWSNAEDFLTRVRTVRGIVARSMLTAP